MACHSYAGFKGQSNGSNMLPRIEQDTPPHVRLRTHTGHTPCFRGGLQVRLGTSNRAFRARLLTTSITDVNFRNVDLLVNKFTTNFICCTCKRPDINMRRSCRCHLCLQNMIHGDSDPALPVKVFPRMILPGLSK